MRVRKRSGERGASLVELALILPVLALLVFGTIDLARAYRMNIRLEAAAREAAGFQQIFPNDVACADPTPDVVGRAEREDPDLPALPGYAVTAERKAAGGFTPYAWCEAEAVLPLVNRVGSGERVRTEVTATFEVLTPIVSNLVGQTLQLTGSAEVVTQ